MKVAVIGSRGLSVTDLGRYLPENTTEIVSGGAKGVDTSAREYALAHGIKLTEFLPEYTRFGRSAPLKRNITIIEYSDIVLAFWDGKSRGTKFVIDNCRKASYGYDQRLEVFGSKAQASAANDTPTHVAFIDENGKVTDKPLYFFLERYMQSFTDEMTEFIDCVLHDKPTKTTVEDGLQALRMGLAAKKSLAEHRPVKLSEIEA